MIAHNYLSSQKKLMLTKDKRNTQMKNIYQKILIILKKNTSI